MHTVLLNLPWTKGGRLGVRAGSRWPFTLQPEKDGRIYYVPFPFFLAYATAYLKKHKKGARLIDAIAEELDVPALISRLKLYSPALILAETSTPSYQGDLAIMQSIHENFPDCKIALCGPHASTFPSEILRGYQFIDYVLVGEYEYTLLELVNALEGSLSARAISSLAYRENHAIVVNNTRSSIEDLDTLPWPEREDVPIYRYNDAFAEMPVPTVQMWSSRGCPFQCKFCLWPQTMYREHKYRMRNPRDVVDEMEHLVNRYGFKAVFFDDDIFNVNKGHILGICREIKKRSMRIPWAAMARADLMDGELLAVMRGAGLSAIKYGIESVDNAILKSCRKNLYMDKAESVITITKKLGVKVHLTFCIGLPGETRQTIRETAEFARRMNPDSLQFSFATPFPGTEYFEDVKEKGNLLSNDWSDYDGGCKCVVKTKELSPDALERIRSDLCSSFNLQ